MHSAVTRPSHTARVQDSGIVSGSVGGSGSARLTPEMCRAIKRQEVTSGMDYWKVGHNGISTQVQDRRPTYRRLTQVNLDFPGAFLPNVTNQQTPKPKRKEPTGLVLNRSRTSFMPSILQPKTRDKASSKRQPGTDLTCLQLADTLFATRSSGGFAGFFNFAFPRSGSYDYWGSDSDDRVSHGDRIKVVPTHSVRLQGPIPRGKSVSSAIKYRTFQPEDNKTLEDRDRYLYSPSSPVFPTRWNELFSENKKGIKPQKSILKNGSSKQNEDGNVYVLADSCQREAGSSFAYTTASPISRCQNGQVRLESINPELQRGDSPGRYSADSSHSEGELRFSGVSSDMSSKKRSVRFNADHEIREYKPCEPVSYC